MFEASAFQRLDGFDRDQRRMTGIEPGVLGDVRDRQLLAVFLKEQFAADAVRCPHQ
jgi:hypothetical protein